MGKDALDQEQEGSRLEKSLAQNRFALQHVVWNRAVHNQEYGYAELQAMA